MGEKKEWEPPVDYGKVMRAAMWWNALLEITKIAIWEDLFYIKERDITPAWLDYFKSGFFRHFETTSINEKYSFLHLRE